MKGYTNVWSGSSEQMFDIADQWQPLAGTDYRRAISDGCGQVSVYVANEYIDWMHYRQTGEYICRWGQTQQNPMRGRS